ncbi:chromosome segregation ATPase [Marinithermofilum abyssi]|uniref:Chromosome segregation ATPase n=1 Tax=Marinithermofilum abyssi TaxID=1571185 RepID=A0A8J2VHE0_9BACL|nr:ATP-binding protein [Marinithermofilum abyssi]GGE24810.1 chromosome segregation ATPase [Marinithermofilum abyssi]
MDRLKSLEQLAASIEAVREEALKREARKEELERRKREIEAECKQLGQERELFDKVRVLLQESADYARMQAKEQMEGLVTNALQYVFGPLFRFEIELFEHSGKPSAEFYVITEWEGQTVRTKPQDARGGGIVDIVSLALRVAMVETFRPRPEGPLILDEPGKHVSADYVVPMLEFLKSIGETFGRQVILVTHDPHLSEGADQAYHVSIHGGRTVVWPSRLLDNGTN